MAGIPKNASDTYKALLKKISEHGATVVEAPEHIRTANGRVMKAERLLIALEAVYLKGVNDGNMGALQYYLDRMLGKPKESLNLTNESDIIGKLTDEQLIERISAIVKTAAEGGAGNSD